MKTIKMKHSHKMDVLVSALKDIIKFKAVAWVNTGDKTLDNLLNVFVVALITLLFTSSYYSDALTWISYYNKPSFKVLDAATKKKFSLYLTARRDKLSVASWDMETNEKFTNQFLHYVIKSNMYPLSGLLNIETEMIDFDNGEMTLDDVITERLEKNIVYTIFVDKGGQPVGMVRQDGHLHLAAEKESSIIELIRHVKTIDLEPSAKKTSKYLRIYEWEPIDGNEKSNGTVYPDRTLESIVSIHKPTIMNYLRDFESALLTKSKFDGMGSYNFGLILYGSPGTGKTSFIKGICNHLRRPARIVNMQNIQTIEDLKKVFDDAETRVIVFEELDCVDGVLRRDTKVQASAQDTLKQLKEEYLRVLMLQSKPMILNGKTKKSKKKDDNSEDDTEDKEKDEFDPVQQELQSIKKEMNNVKNKLTLYTFLTVLDGMNEMRGRVIIATTNHIERIDPALLRPGRFDLKIQLEQFTSGEIRELLHKMFASDAKESMIDEATFAEKKFAPVEIITLCHIHQTLPNVIRALSVDTNLHIVPSAKQEPK